MNLQDMMAFYDTSPFLKQLGVTVAQSAPGQVTLLFELQGMHLNSFGVAHGGVLMTLLDAASAGAARTLAQPNLSVLTVEMKTTFLSVASGQLWISAHVLQQTATLAFAEASVKNQAGKVFAKASATLKYVKKRRTMSAKMD